MSLVLPFWTSILRELWGGRDKLTSSSIFMLFVRMAMAWCFMVVLTQQFALVNATWSVKLMEHDRNIKEYTQLQCAFIQTTNVLLIGECDRLNAAMRVTPIIAATTAVINGWNTCLTMPCTQLMYTISSHYEYKLLFLLVSFGFAYYASKFFTTTRDKTIELQDMIRAEVTRRYKNDCMPCGGNNNNNGGIYTRINQ